MRLLHVSDFHFNRDWFEWLNSAAPDYEAVALTGDLIGPAQAVVVEEQIAWLRSWAESFPALLFLCSGNHDFCDDWIPPPQRYWMRKIRSPKVMIDGQSRRIGGWTFESVGWNEMPMRGGPHHLALVHCPPMRAATAIGHPECVDWGDFELADLLRHGGSDSAPRILLSGHVHRPRAWQDRIGSAISLNPGVNAGAPYPNHICLDLAAGTAEHRGHGCLPKRIKL